MIYCEKCNSIHFITAHDALNVPYLICRKCGQATLDTRFIEGQKQQLYEELEPYKSTLKNCHIDVFDLIEMAETKEQIQSIRSLSALMVAKVYKEVYR